jgi:hypothetical protein
MVMRDRRDTQGTNARRVQTPVQTSDLGKPCTRQPRPDVVREPPRTYSGASGFGECSIEVGSDSNRDPLVAILEQRREAPARAGRGGHGSRANRRDLRTRRDPRVPRVDGLVFS